MTRTHLSATTSTGLGAAHPVLRRGVVSAEGEAVAERDDVSAASAGEALAGCDRGVCGRGERSFGDGLCPGLVCGGEGELDLSAVDDVVALHFVARRCRVVAAPFIDPVADQ